ncbi:hypothetical protein B0A49_04316 [Cryomyces minteri]|uniref:EamA domain-containing protein n=2 Tax=Cryomyces minteri TaxID=331657 RepID=A0A4U0X4D8_9PEZI|nr:hypothetical protein B0A49_04316 [Cryomyces minteri]
MAVKAVIPFLVGMMLLTGVCNTLLTKYQDMQCVRNCSSRNPSHRAHFEQPVIQTAQMFVGEMGCWLVIAGMTFYRRYIASSYQSIDDASTAVDSPLSASHNSGEANSHHHGFVESEIDPTNIVAQSLVEHEEDDQRIPLAGWRVILLALPACCDIAGTTLMNVGLLFVAASIYQMTRGALVLFVGLFSVLFLKRRLSLTKWIALVIVVAGVAVVGVAGAIAKDDKATPGAAAAVPAGLLHTDLRHPLYKGVEAARVMSSYVHTTARTPEALHTLLGILLIAFAQIFTASQFVIEESIMERYALAPVKVVAWEGTWGFTVTAVGMVILHFAVGRTESGRHGYFDMREGLGELFGNRRIGISSLLIMVSIGGFNFFGISVTRTVSATSRSTIDTCRTLFIWIVSLGLGWETFKWLQVLGFALLVYGTFLFNELIKPVGCGNRRKADTAAEREALTRD